jgi:hypothetical protein
MAEAAEKKPEDDTAEVTAPVEAAPEAAPEAGSQELVNVGEQVAAGKAFLVPPNEQPADSTGPIRIDITPVTISPRPEAGTETITDVELRGTRPFVTTKTLKEPIEKSVAEITRPTTPYEDAVAKLKAGQTITFNTPAGAKRYIPEVLPAIEKSKAMELQFRADAALDSELRPDKLQTDTVIAGKEPVTQKVDPTQFADDPNVQDKLTLYTENRMRLDNELQPHINTGNPSLDTAVRQFFIDDFNTGNFYESLATRLAEQSRGMVTLPAYAAGLTLSLIDSAAAARMKGTPFSDEWASRAEEREVNMRNALEKIDTVLPAPTAAMFFNQAIRDRFQLEFNEGRINEAQLNEALFTTDMTGERIPRDYISDEGAYDIIDLAFKELSGKEQFGVILAENLIGGGFLSSIRMAEATRYVKHVNELRKKYDVPDDVRLSNLQSHLTKHGKKVKIDQKLYDLGVFGNQLKVLRVEQKARRDVLTSEMQDAAKQFGKGSLQYKRLKSEYDNIGRAMSRNFFQTKVSPQMLQSIKDDTTLAAGAYLGSTYLEGAFGMDRDMAEMAGFFSTLVAGPQRIRFVGRKVVGGARATLGLAGSGSMGLLRGVTGSDIRSPIPALFRKLTMQDMTADDYERLYYMPAHGGERMPIRTKRAIRRAFKEVDKMSPENKLHFRALVQEQMDLRDEIINAFPEQHRDMAGELYDMSFAEATGLVPLIGSYKSAVDQLNMNSIRKGGIQGVIDATEDIDRRARQAQVFLNNFKAHISTYANPESKQEIGKLMDNVEATITRIEDEMARELNAFDEALDTAVSAIALDSKGKMPEAFLDDVIEAKTMIAMRAPERSDLVGTIDSEAARVTAAKEVLTEVETDLINRLDEIQGERDNRLAHIDSLKTTVEAVFNTRYQRLMEVREEAYSGFRSYMNNRENTPTIDISNVVEKMLDMAKAAEDGDIIRFFGPEATFFSGFMGRQSMKMFNRMINRRLAEIGEDSLSEIVRQLKDEHGVDAKFLDDMAAGDPVRFGLFLHSFGKVNMFKSANIEELEELRKAFRDYGYKVKDGLLAKEMGQFKNLVDEAMENGDPEGFAKLKEARGIYQASNDPLRLGTPLQKLNSSKQGEKVDLDSGPYVGIYRNVTPYDIAKKVGNTIADVMSGGPRRTDKLDVIQKEISSLEQLFGTHISSDGRKIIDLDTEEGQKAFDTLKGLTDEIVYQEWAGGFVDAKPGSGVSVLTGLSQFAGAANATKNLSAVTARTKILVKKGGKEVEVALSDVSELISNERNIENYIGKGKQFQEEGEEAIAKITAALNASRRVGKTNIQKERRAIDVLKNISESTSDPAKFYNTYIAGPRDLDSVRDSFIFQMKKDPSLELSDDEIADLFDQAVYHNLYQALMEIGQYGPQKTMGRARNELADVVADENGARLVRRFGNTVALLDQLGDENVRKNLLKVMPEDQITHLQNITKYIANQEAIAIAGNAIAKGISANEAISRAYNIARDMVSPSYIASEVAVRIMQKNASDAFYLAMSDMEAAKIMEKIMLFPELVTPKELSFFEDKLIEFAMTDVVRKGQEEATLAYFNQVQNAQTEAGDEDEAVQ